MPVTAEQVDQCLPQTQCQQCGYPRCLDYATAIAHDNALTNRCPPGGAQTRTTLAQLLHTEVLELDPECGQEQPRLLFRIREKHCIGCTLCIQACPVDAVLGRSKRMHTVLADECTGCGLCVPVCPVDCIEQHPHPRAGEITDTWPGFLDEEAARARNRTNARLERLAKRASRSALTSPKADASTIREEIAAAVARVQQKRQMK